MNLSNLLYPALIVFSGFLLLSLPSFMAETEPKEPEPCIPKKVEWCEEHNRQEVKYKIFGHWYLAEETPHGQYELLGLDTRYHDSD